MKRPKVNDDKFRHKSNSFFINEYSKALDEYIDYLESRKIGLSLAGNTAITASLKNEQIPGNAAQIFYTGNVYSLPGSITISDGGVNNIELVGEMVWLVDASCCPKCSPETLKCVQIGMNKCMCESCNYIWNN